MRDRLELRAQDPVARCLIRRLMVPRIYLDAEWPTPTGPLHVDVLAIDRDGTGDAHVVEIVRVASNALARLPALFDAQAPFRWIAFLRGTEDEASTSALASQESLFARETSGRIGVIEIVELAGGDIGANVRIAAERFPVSVFDVATEFSGSHKAHIQFGE